MRGLTVSGVLVVRPRQSHRTGQSAPGSQAGAVSCLTTKETCADNLATSLARRRVTPCLTTRETCADNQSPGLPSGWLSGMEMPFCLVGLALWLAVRLVVMPL